MIKLHFFMTVTRTFNPLLKKYQTDKQMMPVLSKGFAELIKVMWIALNIIIPKLLRKM